MFEGKNEKVLFVFEVFVSLSMSAIAAGGGDRFVSSRPHRELRVRPGAASDSFIRDF